MLRRSIKLMAAAAVLGISPALLPAQSPLDGVDAQPESNAQVKPDASAPKAPLDDVQKQNDADSKTEPDTKLDAESETKAKGNVKTPDLAPPSDQVNPADAVPKADPADGALKRVPQDRKMKNGVREGVDQFKGTDADMQKRFKNPLLPPDGKRQTFQGQGNFEIDDVVLQGTAHLNIDDETRARYRHHNGHWWFKTENDQWLIDNNGQWAPFDPVTYRESNRRMNQEYYQDQGQVDGDFQTYSDDGYYYNDSDCYSGNGYGNRGYYNRGNGYYGNRYYNHYRNGDGRYDRGNNNRGHYNNNSGRRSSGYRGQFDSRQGAGIEAEIDD